MITKQISVGITGTWQESGKFASSLVRREARENL